MNCPGLLPSWRSCIRLAVFILVSGVAGLSSAGTITLSNSQVPAPPGQLVRLKLSRSTAPTAFVQQVLANTHPGSQLGSLAQSTFAKQHGLTTAKDIQAAIDNDHVVASVDPATGHADVVPDLASLVPQAKQTDPRTPPPLPAAAADQAKTAAAGLLRSGLFPSDATHAALQNGLTLVRSQFNAGTGGGAPTFAADKSGPLAMTFPVQRLVGNLPVSGIGSRGSITVGPNGKVVGFSRHWQNATNLDTTNEARTPAQIADLIRQQLAGLAAKGDVVVTNVQLGYYDGDKGYIQPVYQFVAKVHVTPPAGQTGSTDDDYIVGNIPAGDKAPLESIPQLTDKPGNNPNIPQGAPTNLPLSQLMPVEPPTPAQMAAMTPRKPAPGDPTLGRYVVRNDYSGWVNSANGFWDGLWWSGYQGYFTNSQYFWAYPFEYQGSKNAYINSVNIAESEVHGDWWYWTTYQNWGDGVTVDSIPAPGLGASAGGSCAYFILHSCETTPSAADTYQWPDHWWHVFGGLHSVLGYRTIMMIDDGIMFPFGMHMGWGYALVNAWLNDVVSSGYYCCGAGEVMHGVWKPYGRPSTVSVCGHEGDSAYYTAGVGPAGCLTNYWYY